MVEQAKKKRSDVRNQHYVPRCLMSAFAKRGGGKKHQVHVFDKRTDRSFLTATDNIFSQRDFNTFEGADGTVLCLEDGMAAIEDIAAPVLRKLVQERSLAAISEEERMALIVFVALQKVRGVGLRVQFKSMTEALRRRIQADGTDPDTVAQLREGGDENLKLTSLQFVRDHLLEFTKHYLDKVLVLHASPREHEFLLGDAAVVWANRRDTGPYGNLGLGVVGIELYMPLSPNLALAFWCPSIVDIINRTREGAQDLARKLSAMSLFGVGREADDARRNLPNVRATFTRAQGDLDAISAGAPLQLDTENMRYVNSLQVSQSEQYIVSSNGDFSFVKEMIGDNSAYRQGQQINFA